MQATTTSSRSASASSCGSIAQASDASDRRIESFEQGQLPRTRQAFNDSRAVIESFAAEIADGSKSFALATRLFPPDVRAGALFFYAYCRRADDAIDESDNPQRALCELKAQLDRIFGEARQSDKLELALQHLVGHYQIPRAPFDWLLEGFSWDAGEKVYATQEDLVGYAVRVAGTIGLVMAMMMGRHDEYALARATDPKRPATLLPPVPGDH